MSDVGVSEELLTVREVARLLRVGESTVRRWIGQGDVPALTLPGGDHRVPRVELLRCLGATRGVDVERVFERAERRLRQVSDDELRAEVRAVRAERASR